MAERFDLGNKLVGYAVESGFHIRVAGFGDVVGRSPRERFQCNFRASFRERAEHYDGHGHAAVELADLRNGFEPVHLRHLDIEQNYVRTQLSKLRQRQAAIAGRAYHFERGIARERVGERFVDDHRVIHDKHARLGRSSQSVPSLYARPVTWPRRSSPELACSRAHCLGRRC